MVGTDNHCKILSVLNNDEAAPSLPTGSITKLQNPNSDRITIFILDIVCNAESKLL